MFICKAINPSYKSQSWCCHKQYAVSLINSSRAGVSFRKQSYCSITLLFKAIFGFLADEKVYRYIIFLYFISQA